MILTSFELSPLSLSLRKPLRTARGEYRVREGLVLVLKTRRHVGFGEAMPLVEFGTEGLEDCRSAITQACEALMTSALPEDIAAMSDALDRCGALHSAPAARHAVESAALDLLARGAGVPFRDVLTARSRSSVEVNALLGGLHPAELFEEARAAKARGFRVVKVKVAQGEDDVARVSEVRRGVGADVRIRIDANGGWTEREAQAQLQSLGRFALELCEQPVEVSDRAGLKRLRGKVPCLIAADEVLQSHEAAQALISAPEKFADVLVLRPMVLGGPLRTVRLAHEAQARGYGSYVSSSLDGPLARAVAANVAAAIPGGIFASGLATGALFDGDEQDALAPVSGRITLPNVAGLGVAETIR